MAMMSPRQFPSEVEFGCEIALFCESHHSTTQPDRLGRIECYPFGQCHATLHQLIVPHHFGDEAREVGISRRDLFVTTEQNHSGNHVTTHPSAHQQRFKSRDLSDTHVRVVPRRTNWSSAQVDWQN